MSAERHCDEHDPCEGPSLHIRARDAKGCAQFQDGSWLTKERWVCFGPHEGSVGQGEAVRTWLEGEFAANRARKTT